MKVLRYYQAVQRRYGWYGVCRRLRDYVFTKEEINGERCPTYLYRWCLLRICGRAVYLHHFVGNDWTRDLHDHPKRFITVGLRGSYIEENDQGEQLYRAPWIRTFPATHRHRLRATNCWTLAVTLKSTREWGFWHGERWIQWETYVDSVLATMRRDC